MVFYFYPRCHVPNTEDFMIYMGKDKVGTGANDQRRAAGVPVGVAAEGTGRNGMPAQEAASGSLLNGGFQYVMYMD